MTRLALLVLLTLLAAPAFATSGSASGTLHIGPPACMGSTCGDHIAVTIHVGAQDVGHHGAIFIALLPVNGKGKPVAYRGAWATQQGWQVGQAPAAYARGTLPATWHRVLTVRQGICTLASQARYHGSVGVFAGYGEVTPPPSHRKAAQSLLSEAKRLHDPKLVARIQRALAPNPMTLDASAAHSMLKAHTVWFLGSTRCE